MNYIRTIKELTTEQRCNWLRRHNPEILGTRRNMSLEEWLDSIKVPQFRITSQRVKKING